MEKTLNQLLSFAAIVEQGSITKAALFLGASKSSVSKKLRILEQTLALQLFHREHKKLTLTDAGKSIYQQCEDLTSQTTVIKHQVEAIKEIPSGSLHINISSALGEYFSRTILPDFQRAYPEISIHLSVTDSQADFSEACFDVAIRVMSNRYNDLSAKKLGKIESIICAAPRYLENQTLAVTTDTLSRHNCLLWESEESGVLKQWRLQHRDDREDLIIPVHGDFHSNHLPSLKATLLCGRGIAFLPRYLISAELDRGQLTTLFNEYSNTSTALYAFFTPQRQKPKKLQVLLDFLQQYFELEKGFI
ncbi:MAG: LysR family transcriptional regulator [Pseudomonadales bacterium]|nr:LysR family transcriptional regulator [Pseudomonadales bacterium]